jgi:hypothetical protein
MSASRSLVLLRDALFSLPCALRRRTALSPRACAAFNGQASAVAFVNWQNAAHLLPNV